MRRRNGSSSTLKRCDNPEQIMAMIVRLNKQAQTRKVTRTLVKLRARYAKLQPKTKPAEVSVQP